MGPLSEQDCAYAAGLFDGEGCVAIRRQFRKTPAGSVCESYTLWVQISNVHPAPIARLRDQFGGSCQISRYKKASQRDCYVWCMAGPLALIFLEAIRPWLVIKADQADIGIEFQRAKKYRGKLGMAGEDRTRERRQYQRIAELKFCTYNPADFGMVANSGNGPRGKPRAKQVRKALGVCNEQEPPSTEKICSGLHGNMQSAAETTAPGPRAE